MKRTAMVDQDEIEKTFWNMINGHRACSEGFCMAESSRTLQNPLERSEIHDSEHSNDYLLKKRVMDQTLEDFVASAQCCGTCHYDCKVSKGYTVLILIQLQSKHFLLHVEQTYLQCIVVFVFTVCFYFISNALSLIAELL